MQAEKGFTLIELIVVIVILGILSAVALPKFVNISGDARPGLVHEIAPRWETRNVTSGFVHS